MLNSLLNFSESIEFKKFDLEMFSKKFFNSNVLLILDLMHAKTECASLIKESKELVLSELKFSYIALENFSK